MLGGIILVFATPEKGQEDKVRDLIQHVGQVVQQGLGGWEWDGVKLAVGVGEGEGDEWDELCAGAGIEYVQIGGSRGAALQEFGGTPYSIVYGINMQLTQRKYRKVGNPSNHRGTGSQRLGTARRADAV